MRHNSEDKTLKKNYIQKYQYLISTYEAIKRKEHPIYIRLDDFYKQTWTCRQTFIKYYNRYKQSGDVDGLLPQKRGPRYQTRRCPAEIERAICDIRARGCNKFEIHDILLPDWQDKTPSASGIYQVFKRYNMNKLTPESIGEKQKIIKEKAGQMGHVDCHHLSRDLIATSPLKLYLVCIVDDQSRIAWAEVVQDIKSLTVMFATLRCMNMIHRLYKIKFEEILTDNGPEFGLKTSTHKDQHPFERMLIEMGIKHRYTRPYRPQTNGKVERFWRTLNEDLIEGTYFESTAHFREELEKYMYYYNELRPHQALNGQKPKNAIIL